MKEGAKMEDKVKTFAAIMNAPMRERPKEFNNFCDACGADTEKDPQAIVTRGGELKCGRCRKEEALRAVYGASMPRLPQEVFEAAVRLSRDIRFDGSHFEVGDWCFWPVEGGKNWIHIGYGRVGRAGESALCSMAGADFSGDGRLTGR